MIIDIHAHLGTSWVGWSEDYADLEGFIRLMDQFGVDISCVNSWQLSYDPIKGNKEIFDAVKKYPERLIGFGVISPRYKQTLVKQEIDKCIKEYGMKGLKLHPTLNGYYADSTIVDPVMEKAIHYDIPLLFHTWNDDYSNPRRIATLAQRFPQAKIIMAHMGFEDWLEAIVIAEKAENIYLDTTGTTTEWLIIKTAVERCGEDKILFGSDSPALNLGAELAKVKDAQISQQAKEKILYKNAVRLLKLSKV